MKSQTYTYRVTEDDRERLSRLAHEMSKRSGYKVTPPKVIKRAVKELEKIMATNENQC